MRSAALKTSAKPDGRAATAPRCVGRATDTADVGGPYSPYHGRIVRTQLHSVSLPVVAAAIVLAAGASTRSQSFPTADPVIREMWRVGMEQSETEALAHTLVDVIGPRLAGSPNLAVAQDWLIAQYQRWGVPARKEQYGTWTGWQQGILHVDLLEPRVRTLEAHLLAWSPGTDGIVEGEVVMPPEDLTEATADAWLATLQGKFVLLSAPEIMCRARQELEANARPETVEQLAVERQAVRRDWAARLQPLGMAGAARRIEDAGALGTITSQWSGGWGVNKVFGTANERAVGIDLSCEDYGLLFRLASGEPPVIRVQAEAEFLGTVPQFNVIAELEGAERPDEYVLLGAHLDSWHSASGATDNGTGTITMLEAMRILSTTYPRPKRTIMVGHWGGEEIGAIGSNAFRVDHPDVVEGLQVAFNQDNGTWRFERIEGQGLIDLASHLPRWMAALPTEFSRHITLELPGTQANQGSDHISFLCAGAPSVRLQSPYDEYRQYTWHTDRDTYDKIVFDDLKENATVAAMLAYMAAEDPLRVGRGRALLPVDGRTGEPRPWPECNEPRRDRN